MVLALLSITYTINENDGPPEIQFNITASDIAEAGGSANIQVELNQVSAVDASAIFALDWLCNGRWR